MPLKVEVTEHDIAKAYVAMPYFIDNMSHHCPIANALERQLPSRSITVCYGCVYIDSKQYRATPQYRGIIEKFALSPNWVPTTFEIEAL